MKPSATLLLLAIIGFTWSCKKDNRVNEGTELLRVESTFKTGEFQSRTFRRNASENLIGFRDSSGAGTLESISIEYGANDRISKVNYLNNQGQALFHHEFEYNTDGRISKRQAVAGILNIADDYNIYTYDASGHLTIDSQFQKSGLPPQVYHIAKVSRFIYTGENVTEARLYVSTGGTMQYAQIQTYDYDNKINPYKQFDYMYFIMEGNSSIGDIHYVSASNVTRTSAANAGMAPELLQLYKYQYNSSGYPWKVTHEYDPGGQGLKQGVYFYK